MSSFIWGMICGAIISTMFILLGFYMGVRWEVHESLKDELEERENDR
jgi:hypothetical protein